MNYKEFKQKLLEDPEFRKEYNRLDLKFKIWCIIEEFKIHKASFINWIKELTN